MHRPAPRSPCGRQCLRTVRNRRRRAGPRTSMSAPAGATNGLTWNSAGAAGAAGAAVSASQGRRRARPRRPPPMTVRKRETETDRQTDTHTRRHKRHRARAPHPPKERDRERQRDTVRQRETERDSETKTERERERQHRGRASARARTEVVLARLDEVLVVRARGPGRAGGERSLPRLRPWRRPEGNPLPALFSPATCDLCGSGYPAVAPVLTAGVRMARHPRARAARSRAKRSLRGLQGSRAGPAPPSSTRRIATVSLFEYVRYYVL
jgi:hypothetical protein